MIGRRLKDGDDAFAPGDYGRLQVGGDEKRWVWHARPPRGDLGSLANHSITEHVDGTITVYPSILITSRNAGDPQVWHGWLRLGKWSECP